MPLTTGQETKPILRYPTRRWIEQSNGLVFRIPEDSEIRRLYEGSGVDKDGNPVPKLPVRHVATVELLSGSHTLLVWRHDQIRVLSRFWPAWLLRLLKPHEDDIPTLPPASSDGAAS